MNNNTALHRALKICIQAHRNQEDKAGVLYALHPIAVMSQMDTVDEKVVALLHDVIEDTSWTLQDLKNEGFSASVLRALTLLTKPSGADYSHYIARITTDHLARKVKMADLRHNMDASRVPLTIEAGNRLLKYNRALNFLKEI